MSNVPVFVVAEREQVHRREIAGGVVEEHVFRARIASAMIGPDAGQVCQSLMVVWNCRPGSAQAQAAWPIFSHRSRAFSGLGDLAGLGAPGQVPVAVGFDRLEELVGDAHRVVGVLAGDGEIGLASPSRCRRSGSRCRCSPACANWMTRWMKLSGTWLRRASLISRLQRRVLLRLEAVVARALAVDAGLQHRLAGASG